MRRRRMRRGEERGGERHLSSWTSNYLHQLYLAENVSFSFSFRKFSSYQTKNCKTTMYHNLKRKKKTKKNQKGDPLPIKAQSYLTKHRTNQKRSFTKHQVHRNLNKNMASKSALVLCLINLLFFTVVTSTYVPCPPPPNHSKSPKPSTPSSPSTNPPSSPSSSGGNQPSCPRDALKLGVCADVLGLINVQLGNPPKTPCCSLIQGLTDLEAAVCLCTALKANVLGINLNLPISLSLVLNYCGKGVPKGFQCA